MATRGKKAITVLTKLPEEEAVRKSHHPKHTFDLRDQGEYVVDLSDYKNPKIASALLGVVITRSQTPKGSRKASISLYITVIRNFLSHLENTRRVHLEMLDLSTEDLNSWEARLREHKQDRTVYKYLDVITNFLRQYGYEHPLQDELKERLLEVCLGPKGEYTPRPALEGGIEIQLLNTINKEVEVVTSVKPQGSKNLELNTTEKLVFEKIQRNEPIKGTFRYNKLDHSPLDLYGCIYPLRTELEPLFLKFAMLTGWEPETINNLTADCLGKSNGKFVEVKNTKHRRHGKENLVLNIPDGDLSTPGGILRYVLVLTKLAREHSKLENLWIGWWQFRNKVIPFSFVDGYLTWKNFIERNNIVSATGEQYKLNLTNIRKTFKMNRYIESHGNLDKFVEGHGVNVAVKHYAALPELTDKHQDAVICGITALLSSEAPTEEQTWLGLCTDKKNSPFSEKGKDCQALPWSCFFCPNSIITSNNLPAVLAFRDAAYEMQGVLTEDEWINRLGRPVATVEAHILPNFTSQQISVASGMAQTHPIKDLTKILTDGDIT